MMRLSDLNLSYVVRYLLLCLALLLAPLALAQSTSWIYTEGPGFEVARSAPSIIDSRPAVIVDEEGHAVVALGLSTYALDTDGTAWTQFADERDVIAVVDEDHFIAATNLFFSGSGQNPFNEYFGSAEIFSDAAGEPVNMFSTEGGFVERAATSPAGDVWLGIQRYEGTGPSSEPVGSADGVSVVALSADDLEGGLEDWTLAELPDAQTLLTLQWTTLGPVVGTDNGLFAESGGAWARLAFESTDVYSVAESSSGTLFAAVSDDSGPGLVFRSSDSGATWTEVWTLPDFQADILAVEGAVLAATSSSGVFRSEDDGTTWTPTDLTASAVSLAGQPTGPYFAAGYAATLHRSDDGQTWAPVNFVADVSLALTATPEGVVALTPTDLYRFEEDEWSPMAAPSGRNTAAFAVAPDGAYYLSIVYGRQSEEPGEYLSRLYRSQNAGGAWVLANSLVGVPDRIEVTDEGTLLVTLSRVSIGGNHFVFRSDDGGANWTSTLEAYPATSLRQSASGTVRVTSSDRYWSSTDDGLTWTEHPFAPGSLQDVVENEDGSLVATSSAGVYLAADDGQPWLPSSHTTTVRDLARNAAGDLFIGASECDGDPDGTICRSTDGGAAWSTYAGASPFSSVRTLAVDESGVLFVRGPSPTLGQAGTYRTLESTVDVEGEPPAIVYAAAYPNPVTRHAHLRFSTTRPGHVSVTVYDALGRVVRVLRNADLGTGSYEVGWDAVGVASGTYFVRIVTPSETQTLPITVLR